MNDGKICVSVCAETAEEFIRKIEHAAEVADIIELRFDCLKKEEIDNVWKSKASSLEEITTFRPSEQGGKRELDNQQRITFWQSGYQTLWGDFEADLFDIGVTLLPEFLICSHHDFVRTPKDLSEIYSRISKKDPDVVKIAIQANGIVDSISVWNLLETAKSENQEIIPIAMGEAGKWTRILGLAYGAPLTYASLEEGNETAPGQISAKDLIDVYRVKELDRETEIYGVIGKPVSHSLSPYMHNAAFKHHKLNAVYIPFEVSNLEEFIKRMVRPETREIDWNLKGFSVTIPHKEAIIKHLDFVDETATKIGAVNTVKIIDNELHGFNTDAIGFIEPLREKYPDLKDAKVGIIGNGGAARACIYALNNEANITLFVRNPDNAKILLEDFGVNVEPIENLKSQIENQSIMINTTPLGMKGELETQSPATAEELKNLHLAYDLVYNPIKTRFLREAENAGIPTIGGIEMLIAQGTKQFEIWTERKAPKDLMRNAAFNRIAGEN